MRTKRVKARPEQEVHIRDAVKFCEKHRLSFAGFPFLDGLMGLRGIHLELLVPPGTPDEQIQVALREAYRERDVVKHDVVECPPEWLVTQH